MTDAVELVHRVIGYPFAFLIGPFALATFAGARGHRTVGRTYGIVMTFLYVTGTALTLTRHPWGTWEFGRNATFNLLGYSLLLHGWRAIWLRQRPGATRGGLDLGLLIGQAVLVAAVLTLAVQRTNAPMHVFAVIGLALVALDVRDWGAGYDVRTLYRRHIRYILGSYFYVLTVVSIVHLRDELTADARWLWPSVLAVATIAMVGEGSRLSRWVMRAVLALSVGFGAYVAWEVVRDNGQVERVLGVARPALDLGHEVQVET